MEVTSHFQAKDRLLRDCDASQFTWLNYFVMRKVASVNDYQHTKFLLTIVTHFPLKCKKPLVKKDKLVENNTNRRIRAM